MPFDPTLSTNPEIRKQAAPQIAAQADHERQVIQQQREQERAQAAASRAAEQDQREIDRQNKVNANIQAESAFRASGREFFTDAAGMIRPKVDDATHAAQQVTAKQRADQEIQYKQEGRKFTKNALTGDLVPLESDEILAQRRQKEGDDLRRESITQQMESLKAEAALRPGPMKDTERKALEKQLKSTRDGARFALAPKLQEKAKAVTGGNDYIPFNESPAPEAESAKARLERLMQPDADLDDTDLADLEADPTTAPTVAQLRTLKDKLTLDDEARAARKQTGQTLAEMHLRRTDPAKWEAHQRQKLAALDGPALDAHLASSDEALKTKAADLEARVQALRAPQQQWQAKRTELEQQNAQAKASGIPAGELVTLSDGSTWHGPLAKQLFDIQAQEQAHEGDPEVAKQRKLLEIDAAELQREAKLLSEAAQMRQQKGQEAAKVQSDVRRFTPGFEKAAGELDSLQQEAGARAATVAEMYPEDSPERQAAMQAIEQDVTARAEQTTAQGQQTQAAVSAAYQGIKQRLNENPDLNKVAGDLFVTARKNLSQALGISETEANTLLEDAESQDWSSIQGKHGEAVPDGNAAQRFMTEAAGDKRQYRMLKNGGVIINPVITDPEAYRKAVEASPASPEAKAAAMAVQPDLRQRYGAQALETLTQIGDSGWEKFRAAQPKEVSPEEAAALYADKLKAETGTSGKVLRAIFQSMAQGVDDIGAQALGALSGMTGSESLMKGATALNERAALIEADKQMRGAAGNFALDTAGQFSRLVPSLIPAAGGAKLAQTGLALFARTGIAARMMPGLVAGLKAASTPAAAAKAAATFTQAGIGGAAVAGGAQTYGAQLADIYSTLRREHPEMDHATALRQAQIPAILSGAMTAMLTTVGGATGVEKLLANPAAVKEAFKKQFTSRLAQAGYVAKAAATGGIKEWPEEIADELFSTIAASVATGQSVPQALAQFAESLPELSAAILLLGGLGEGTQAARESSVTAPVSQSPAEPSQSLPVSPELTAAAWAAIENLDMPGIDPAQIEPMQTRAAVALAVAQGGSLEDMEEAQLNAVGWTGRNGKGQTLPPGKIEKLKDYTGPEVLEVDTAGNASVAPSYRAALEQHLPAVAAAIPLSPEPAQSAQKPAAPTGTPDSQQPRGSSGQGPAPATVDAGGETQAGAGAVSSAPAAGSSYADGTPEAERSTQLATHLTTLGLTPEQAAPVADHLVEKQGIKGSTYLDQVVANDFPKILRDLGITGSLAPALAQSNPLRAPADLAARLAKKPVASESPSDRSATVQRVADESPPPARDATPPAAAPAPVSTSPAQPAPSPQVSKSASPRPKLTLVEEDRAQQLAAKITRGGAYEEAEAVALAEEYVAQSAQNNIPLNEQWRKGMVPWLARRETAARGGRLAKGKIAVDNVVEATPDRPADLRAHPAWSRNRLAALSSLPTERRPAARLHLNALERALAQNHALFTTLALGPKELARSIIGEGSMAVQEMDGQIVLAIDLGRLLDQMKNTTTPEAGMTAALVEEAIHAAVLRLAKKTPGKYGLAALVKRWQSLTPALRQKVWESYHAVDIQNGTHSKTIPAQMKDGQQWALMNEFLRMLVQDKAFAGQVSEVAAQDKGLAQWIVDALKDLAQALKDLIGLASPEVQAELNTMVDEIAVTVKLFQGLSASQPFGKAPPAPAGGKTANVPPSAANVATTTDNRASVLSSAPSPQVSGAAVSKSVKGSTGTAYTDANEPIEYQWAVVDVVDLNISNRDDGTISPDYPQELQPRDRTSAGSEAQVADIAKNWNLDRLSISSSVGDGAPIIGPDGVVESGNGRVMGGRRAYSQGGQASQAYRAALIARAGEFGLNAEQVEAVKNPVLVRVRTTEVNRVAFVLSANVSTIAPKRELEQAKIDAKQIVPDLFTNFVPSEDGDVFTAANAAFIRDFVSAIIPPAERPAIMDARGNLSQSGLRRLRNALFVHAYGDSADTLAALGTIAEDIEADGRNLVNTLIAIAPRFAEQNGRIASGALYPLSITEELAKALTTYQEIKARGDTVDAWAAQDTLAGIGERPSDFQRTLVTALHEHRRKPRVLLASLDRYAKAIDGAGDPKQASLFGDEPRPTREELFALATGQTFTQEEAEGWRKLAEAEALANKNRPTGGQTSGAGAVGNVTPAEGSISPVTAASVPQPVPQSSQKSSTPATADVPQSPPTVKPVTKVNPVPSGKPLSTSDAARAIQAKTGLTDRDALAKELERKLSLRPFAAQSMAEAVLNDLAGIRAPRPAKAPSSYTGPRSVIFGVERRVGPEGVPQQSGSDWMDPAEYKRYGGKGDTSEYRYSAWQPSLAKGRVSVNEAADSIVKNQNMDGWLDTYMANGWSDAEREFPGGGAAITAIIENTPPRQHDRVLMRGVDPRFGEVDGRPLYSFSFSPESARMAGSRLTAKTGPTKYLSAEDIALARIRRDGRSHYAGAQSEVWIPASELSLAKGTTAPAISYNAYPTGNNTQRWQNLTPQEQMAALSPGAQVTIDRAGTATAIPPKNALKLYRTLTAKQATAPLNAGQSKALEQAERSLGQLFLFDDPATSLLKPAVDLVLEQETVDMRRPTEQLSLFMGRKALYPRETMPQIPTEQRPALFRYLRALGIRLKQESVPPQSLRPSQQEILPDMAARAATKTEPRVILISQEGDILDGHHQWQAAMNSGSAQVSVIRLGLPLEGALAALDAFPGNTATRPQVSRFASEEYPYLGAAPADWKTATDPEAAIVNPITIAPTPDAQTAALMALGRENIPLVESILSTLQTRLGLEGKWSLKDPDRIMAKASRPSIRAEKPWHDIPHIRDGLRFKVTLDHFKKMPAVMRVLAENGVQVLKFDHAKMFKPKAWGWRFVAWDLKMPNGQLVEFYAPIPELEEAKDAGHLIFEKWRNLPLADYADYGSPRHAEYLADIRLSYEGYAAAFRRGLERMGYATETEAAASWDSLVARASSVTKANFSMASTGEGAPALRQTPSLPLRAPGGDTYTSPESTSSTTNTSGAFMVEDSTDSDGNQAPSLQKGRTAVEDTPDLFSFNTGLGLDALLTPAQKEAKVQKDQQLSLFDELGPRTNAGATRPEKTRRLPRKAGTPRELESPESLPDDLFSLGDSGARVSASRFPRELGLGDERVGGGDIGDGVPGPTDQGTADKPADSVQGDPPGLSLAPAVIPQPADPADRNHRIDGSVAPKGNKAKLEANFAAMKLVRELEAAGRNPTPEEKKTLEAYTGWGWMKEAFNTVRAQKVEDLKRTAENYIAYKPRYDSRTYNTWRDYYTDRISDETQRLLNWADTYLETHERLRAELSEKEFHAAEKSTLNAHFTTPSIIGAMWDAIAKLGFKGGRAMEPGGGIGHFIGVQPEALAARTQWEATELDDVTARILAKLYPQARVNSAMSAPNREVSGMGFQNARIPNNSLDLFISNVPFAKQGPGKAKSEFGQDFNLHNYFFARALSKVKPGGLIAFITTANTMESARAQRDYLNNHGQLVAAVRLPNNAFKENAGTEVTTDIIILRKPDGTDFVGEPWRERIKVGEDVVTAKRKREGSNAQRIDDWLGEIDPEWIPADEALVEPFTAWMRGGRPASGQKRTALMNTLNQLHGFSPMKLDFRAPIYVNEYFARHPENVLGTNRLIGSMYGPGEYTVLPSTEPLESQLAQFVDRLPEDIMSQTATTGFEAKAAERGDKVDSYVEREGRIYQVTKEGLEPVEWQVMPGMDAKAKAAAEKKTAIYTQWAKLREAAVALVQMEANPLADEAEMKAARALLNQVYDRTVEKYGPLSKRRRNNYRFLEDDPEAALLEALEDEDRSTDKAGKVTYTYTKTDIFRRRLIEPQEAPTTAANLEEAVSISMAWQGTVNPQYVGDLLGTDAGLARQQLIEGGHAFEDPASGLLMTADEYLSGPVSDRLRRAIEAAKDSPQYERNVTALREALPPHKAISEASVILGQRWIPDSIYTAFARHIGMEDGTIRFVPELNSFETRGEGSAEDWIVGNKGAKDILDAVLNNETLTYRRYERGEGMIVDEELTASLRVKAAEMRDAFSQFVKTTEEKVPDTEFEGQQIAIPDLAERDFNQKVNGIKPPNFVGDWVKLPGQSGIIWLKPFRKAVLARLITQGRGMMAHGVGSGKTYNQIALAMELRRLGKARKPVIVVQNSTINQFAASFRKAYPQAKILVATPRSYNAKTRARFTARMATGDWDAIIMTHSNVDLIGHSEETVTAYFAKELEELDAALLSSDGSDQQSDLQKARDKLIEKRDEMMEALGERQDDTLNWEDIGVDALIVDEAHAFKNAPVVTNRGRDIKNIPSSGVGSQRAVSMMMKTRSVRERNGQKGVFFATGTPVSNSMAEAFIMLRYIAPDLLEANGIRNFDDFASQYGDVVSQAESTWDGKVKMVDRFAKFVNGQQLINLVRSVFDVAMGNESLGIDVPTVRDGKPKQLVVPATAANAAFNNWVLRELSPRWEKISRKDIENDPRLSAVPIMTMQAGIAAALDPRLIHDAAPDDPNSKVNTAIKEVLRIYKEGKDRSTAQVIFSDLFNSFNMDILEGFAGQPYKDMGESRGTFNLGEDIKAKLIAAGIPEKEIMVVTDQKDEALTNIFDKVNDGDIRVIIGSTARLGVGVNIQERLAAVHHLMPPRDFKPAMMEQRNGRIIRQGNLHAEWRDIAFVDVVERLGNVRLPTKDDEGKTLSPFKRAEAAREWLAENDKDGSIKTEAEAAARVFDIQIIEYGVEKSLDSAVYSMMSAKQGMIAQVLTADAVGNEFEDPSDEIRMSMAEMAAHTMGDPDMIRSVTVDKLFRELRAAYEGFQRMDSGRRSDVRRLSYNIEKSTAMLPRLDTEAERYGKLWEANEGKPVYEFGGITVNTAEKDAKITKPLDLWITENAREMALKGQEERTASLTINGQPFNITVRGEEEAKDGEDGGVYGFVQMARSDRYTNFAGGARGAIQALHRITENAATRAADTRQELAKEQKQLAQIQTYLAQDKAFPRMEELQALQRERQELMQRINARNAPEPRPERDGSVRQGITISPLAQADPDLLTEEVMSALEDAVITDNSLVLPEQLDRKLYKAVNAALESAGGVWSKRDKAHLFAGDPRPYLGLAEMPSLAKGRVSPDTPANEATNRLDRRTAHPSRIAGARVSAESGQALRDDHFARLLTGGLRPDSPAARSDFDWSPGPRLARLLSEAFSAPILTPAQQAAIHALPVNDDGVESMIYLDRENGVIYKKLKNHAEQPSGGIWPQVTWAGRSLSWHLQPANNPRAVGVRLAVMTDLGGTPTEVAAIGPEGHIYLKQPLSSAPKIATEKGSHVTVSTRHLAGLVEIPDKHLEPGSARAWLGIVNGRPWLVTDLHPDNFIGDNQGDARINDPVIGVISMDVLKNVPGLGAVMQEANRRAQDLGDRANRLFKGTTAPSLATRARNLVLDTVEGSMSLTAAGTQAIGAESPLQKLGWNHLDRSASAKLAALTRWTNDTTKAGELVAKWQAAPLAAPFMKWGHILKKELFPDSVLPREIAAKKREMEIKTAMGGQRAMDLVRALSGSPKFSDIAYPPEFAANPIWRTRLYSAMTGEAPMSSLPAPLQALATKLRAMLVEIGQEAVKQGRMSLDTFEMLREGYMPHYYKEDVAREKSLIQRFRLAVRDLLGARTSAWHIVDTQNRERGTGDFRAVEWQPGKWRFRNKEHRDAHYEDFILSQALTQIHAMGGKARTLTVSDLRAPAALSAEVRGALDVIKRQLRTRYQKEAPLSIDAHQKAGLIMDPVYAIARYAAQQAHDNATAEFFNFVAADPQNISDVAAAGFTEVPDNPRYGRLAGKYVTDDVAHQILEMIEAPGDALKAYDTILGWWKTGKTVLNPGTHVRNVLGNVFFSQLAGNSVWNPGNTRYYRDALRAMRNGGPDLMEAYEQGVLGADFVSVELRQTLRQLLPDPATIEEGKPVLGIGKSIGQFAAKVIGNPAHKAYNQIAALYQAEDELFKLAAYLKAKAMLDPSLTLDPLTLRQQAAAHVRHWFPYFDSGSSATLRALGRTAMPFLGFYRESIRIFGHALAERPLALAAGLAVPSIITVLSAMALGLDDDELEQVRKDMRGKGAKLLGPTPLGGVPLFSMLLPERSDQGQLQQFDISAIHPFVDFMGNRVEGGENEDWYQKAWRSFIAAGPIGSLIYSQMTGKDTFGDRTFVEQNMTAGEKITARLDNIAKTLLPPLAPGGTGLASLMKAGERSTNKTFETRSPTQTVLRSVVGLDVRNATPNLYRIAEDWRKTNGYEVQEGMDYGSTTPASRARATLFSVLAQDEPNEKAIANIKKRLAEMGHPITSPQDVNKLLFYRDPLKIIGGDQKRGISAKEAQQQFQASLTGLDRETLAAAQAEYEKIKARAPMLLLR